jgi:hypothetical protein
MTQPAVVTTATDPTLFDRLGELLNATRQDAQLRQEDPVGRALQRMVDEHRQAEAHGLALEAMTLAASLGLPRDEVKPVLGGTLLAMHRLSSRDKHAVGAYHAVAGRLAVLAAEARGRAQLANFATHPAAKQAPESAAAGGAGASTGAEATAELPQPRPDEKPSREELNGRARAYLLKHKDREARGQRSKRVKLEELAHAIGCSTTTASGLPAWKVIQAMRRRRDKGEGGTLEELLADHHANSEPSSAEDDLPGQPQKVWASRR